MSVRIVGQTPKCCNNECVNKPVQFWEQSSVGGSSTVARNNGTVTLHTGSGGSDYAQILDSSQLLKLSRDFCFDFVAQKQQSAGDAVIGLGSSGSDLTEETFYVEAGNAGAWTLTVAGPSATTTLALGSATTGEVNIQVCKRGNKMYVKFNGSKYSAEIQSGALPDNLMVAVAKMSAQSGAGTLVVKSFCFRYL